MLDSRNVYSTIEPLAAAVEVSETAGRQVPHAEQALLSPCRRRISLPLRGPAKPQQVHACSTARTCGT
ncbi:hypothetical protein MCBRY_001299 [Methylocystis bryophila]